MPTKYEAASMSAFAVFVLFALSAPPIIKQSNIDVYLFLSDRFSGWIHLRLEGLDTPLITSVVTFLLWSVVGALVYILLWAGVTVVKDLDSHISPFRRLMIPRDIKVKKSIGLALARIGVRLTACIALIAWIIYSFEAILPYAVLLFGNAFVRIDRYSPVQFIIAFLLTMAVFYVSTVLARLIALRSRVLKSS